MSIRLLPQNIINQISAGEVVERPASVIKELVENSIDSGADTIEIKLLNAGKTFISVRDNGCGMHKEDIFMSIKRHATSKIPDLNLNNISSFGFRGEALAAISSISRLSIKAWTEDEPNGWQLDVNGSEEFEVSPIAKANHGTYIEVRDLFFATPARLKFLKTDATEFFQCILTVKNLAMANNNVSFKFIGDDKTYLNIEKTTSVAQRISDIIGEKSFENLCAIDFVEDDIKITGFSSLPTANSTSTAQQHVFVNNRPIKDKTLTSTINIAYKDLTPMGRYPTAIIFITVPNHDIDVNTHPAKTEVRFKYTEKIKSNIIKAIKSAVSPFTNRTSSFLGSALIDKIAVKPPTLNTQSAKINPAPVFYEPAKPQSFYLGEIDKSPKTPTPQNKSEKKDPAISTQKSLLEPEDSGFLGVPIGQLIGRYILTQTDNALHIIDQHAAQERILYERFKKDLKNNNLATQQFLTPIIIDTSEESVQLIIENKTLLQSVGIGLDKFDRTRLILRYLPVNVIDTVPPESLISHVIQAIQNEQQENLTHVIEDNLFKKLASLACHSSIRGAHRLSQDQMGDIIKSIENHENTGQCNHGRPTYITVKIAEIEKLFMKK